MKNQQVFLRVLELSDIKTTQSWINTEELGEVMGYMPQSLIQQESWFANATKDNSKYIFAICVSENEEHIGNVALGNIDYIDRNAMLSIFIAKESARRFHYGSHAIDLILNFAFNRLNLHRVHLRTSSQYPGALDFYEKIGFKKEGILREHKFQYGAYHDKHLFGMLREEYNSKKSD